MWWWRCGGWVLQRRERHSARQVLVGRRGVGGWGMHTRGVGVRRERWCEGGVQQTAVPVVSGARGRAASVELAGVSVGARSAAVIQVIGGGHHRDRGGVGGMAAECTERGKRDPASLRRV